MASSTSIAQDALPDVADLVVAELVAAELEVVQLAPASPARRGGTALVIAAVVAATSVAALGRDALSDVAQERIAELEARGGGGSPDVALELAAALIHELEAPGGAAAGGGGGGEPRRSPIAAVVAATSIAQVDRDARPALAVAAGHAASRRGWPSSLMTDRGSSTVTPAGHHAS